MKHVTRLFAMLLVFSSLSPARAQDAAPGARQGGNRRDLPPETWLVEKPVGGPSAYTPPMRPIWRLADLKKMHAGQNKWSQQIVLDNEQDATYNSATPGTKITPRMHPDTATVFVVIAGQMRFTVEGQEPVIATRTSIVNIMKNTLYSYEVVGNENALWVHDNVRGYSTLYPVADPKPAAAKGNQVVKVEFARVPTPYSGINRLHFNTLEAIAACKLGPAVQDDRLYLTPNTDFVNPADDKCSTRAGRGNAAPAAAAEAPFNPKEAFGHLHSGAVEWWVIQLGGISGKFENIGELHAVEGDIFYAPPNTWHQMRAEGPSGPSVRLTMGAYQRINMQNAGVP